MDAPHPSTLTVERVETRYLVPRGHPAPERLRDRLDATTRPALQAAGAALGAAFAVNSDESLWLIRRLEIDVAVNAAWDRDEVVRRWAGRIVRRLSETLRDGSDGQDVIRFPNRAAYLARFLTDLARGDAWGRWYYGVFAGLRPLPVSSALRTALGDDPETGLAALSTLTASERSELLRAMTGADLRPTFELLTAGPATNEPRALDAVWSAWPDGVPWSLADETRAALRLYVLAWQRDPSLAGSSLRCAALALVRLAALTTGEPVGNGLLNALDRGDATGLALTVGPRDAELLAPLLRAARGWVRTVGSALGSSDARRTATSAGQGEARFTPFGGAFLILPAIDRLPLPDLAGEWPGIADTDAATLLRLLLLVTCLGAERADAVFGDPTLRDLLGIDPTLQPADAAAWLRGLGARRLTRLVDDLRAWRRDDGLGVQRTLVLARAAAHGRPVAVLVETARGVWLAAVDCNTGNAARPVDPLLGPLTETASAAVLYAESSLVARVQADASCRVEALPDVVETTGEVAETVARLPGLAADLAYLLPPVRWRIPRVAALALAVAGQGALRDIAVRLPGFARSGLPYLHRNFLDLAAVVTEEPERRVVRLGRPPLNLVLAMTGLARGAATLSWTDQPLVLTQAD